MFCLKARAAFVSARFKATRVRSLVYTQGQTVDKRREYFYYIDHQGFLFLEDARIKNFTSCFKDPVFLDFFFKRLKKNDTGRYPEEFPYVSPCGRELNFIRVDDRPIVYHTLVPTSFDLTNRNASFPSVKELATSQERCDFVFAGTFRFPFDPTRLCMLDSGRLYFPSPKWDIALVSSKLALALSSLMTFQPEQTLFAWQGQSYPILDSLDLLPSGKDK
eukprot:m.167188 g.167188  ORF g.167188 m.167188 type:complete len:219 (-) comp25035_c0_seq2:204-860(-)